MDLHNNTHWMEDESVQSIDKRKLEFIASLFQSFQGKSKTEVSSGLMGRLKYAKENGLTLTPTELSAAIGAIRKHATESEQEKIDSVLGKIGFK